MIAKFGDGTNLRIFLIKKSHTQLFWFNFFAAFYTACSHIINAKTIPKYIWIDHSFLLMSTYHIFRSVNCFQISSALYLFNGPRSIVDLLCSNDSTKIQIESTHYNMSRLTTKRYTIKTGPHSNRTIYDRNQLSLSITSFIAIFRTRYLKQYNCCNHC